MYIYFFILVESIKNAPIPQIIFMEVYKDFMHNSVLSYTDACKKKTSDFVGFALYSPSLDIQFQYRISFASVFTTEAFAILYILKYILQKSI